MNGSITNRSRRRRVASKVSVFKDWAIEEGIEVTELLGYFLHLENWNYDKTLSNIGWNIFTHTECFKKPEVSVEEATWIIEKTRMSQSVWTDIRLRLLDRIYLPPVKVIRSENKNHRPNLEEYKNGVLANIQQCVRLTISERLSVLDLCQLNKESSGIAFKLCWGLDGSGDHSNYHLLSKTHFSTKQIMSVCFSIREIVVTDGTGKKIVWTSTIAKGANSPDNTRPLALFPAKEDVDLLREFVPRVKRRSSTSKQMVSK